MRIANAGRAARRRAGFAGAAFLIGAAGVLPLVAFSQPASASIVRRIRSSGGAHLPVMGHDQSSLLTLTFVPARTRAKSRSDCNPVKPGVAAAAAWAWLTLPGFSAT